MQSANIINEGPKSKTEEEEDDEEEQGNGRGRKLKKKQKIIKKPSLESKVINFETIH